MISPEFLVRRTINKFSTGTLLVENSIRRQIPVRTGKNIGAVVIRLEEDKIRFIRRSSQQLQI